MSTSRTNSTAFPLSAAHARALSPALAALSLGSGAGASAAESKAAASFIRRQAYEKAVTVTDLVNAMPPNYREALSPVIRKTADIAEKLVMAKSSLRKLESAKADGKPPSHLLVKVPELQACKEFRDAGSLAQANEAIRTTVAVAQATVIDRSIEAKQGEIEHLTGLLKQETIFTDYQAAIAARWSEVRERAQVPDYDYIKVVDGETVKATAADGTDIHVKSWTVDPTVAVEFDNLVADLFPIANRCRAIVELRDYAMQVKIEKKKVVEKSADVEMADATKPGPSIQALVDKAVAGRVKPLEGKLQQLSAKGGKKPSKPTLAAKKTSDKASTKKKSSAGPKAGPSKANKPSVKKDDKGKRKAGN